MNIEKVVSHANSSIPAYVPVYNLLYADIVNGVYPFGSELPEEAELSAGYGTEPDILRQALAVLLEDDMLKISDGIMTVSYIERDKEPGGVENPMLSCCKREITRIDVSYNYGPATEAALDKLNLRYNEIVLAGNIVYYADNDPVGHAFVQIPAKFVSELDVNLNSEKEVNNFLNKAIYDEAVYVRLSFRNICTDLIVTQHMPVQEGTPLIYIEEILFNSKNDAIARCKFYFLPNEFDIVINTANPFES
jgi:DNA-binding GntR family transcriptional regulator